MYIDSHAHIYNEQFNDNREEVVEKAVSAGVGKIYMPNVNIESIDAMLEAEHRHPGICIPMMGLHPCDVKKDFEKDLYIIEDWLSKRSFSAIGEMGLDFYWDEAFKEQQIEAFRIQVALAKKHKLPVVLHTRNANREAIDLIAELKDESLTGIFHCFSGTIEEAKEMIDLGFLLGIGGVITFKNGGLDKVLPEIKPESLVLETDCPYLAPIPYRGKRNEPAYIPLIAEKLATVLNIDRNKLMEITTKNALRVFKMR
jgi:TatD DNase family protein